MYDREFEAEGAQVVGISVDSVPVLETQAMTLGGIDYPLLSDYWPHGETARKYECLGSDGSAERGTYIIDPDGILQWKEICPREQARNPQEVLEIFRKVKQESRMKAGSRTQS